MTLTQITTPIPGPVDPALLIPETICLPDDDDAPPSTDAYANTLAIVVHDLRGPLTNLSVLLEDIHRTATADGKARLAGNAGKAERIVGQLGRMLGAVLERARKNRDPLACDPVRVNLVEILALAVAVNRPYAALRSIELRLDAAEPVMVLGDQELLFEAFDNLIGNAVDHAYAGTTIDCEAGPAEDGMAEVRISDEGPGFAAGAIARAFRPFTSLSTRPDGPEGSTGLGLWITRLIAERHGGSVDARNRSGGAGAVLTLQLPLIGPAHGNGTSHAAVNATA